MKLTTLLCFVLALLTTLAPAADAPPLTSAERARDPRFADLADAHHAYRLGAALGSLPMNFVSGTPETPKVVAAMKKLAGELTAMRAAGGAGSALELSDPPERSGDPATDYPAIMKYFGACEQQIRKAIGPAKPSPGMPDARACFELGWGGPQWVFAYGAGMEKLRDSLQQNIPGTVKKSGLPAELWEPLFDQARAKVPRDDFAATYRKTYEGIDSFFRKTGVAHRQQRVGLEGARRALAVGFSLGSVALSFVWEKDAAAARTHFAAAWNGITWFDGIAGGKTPPLPKLTGKGEADLEAIKRFLKTQHEEMAEDLDPEDDRAIAPYHYFELGYRAGNARLVNRIDSDEQRARFVESLEKQGRFCELPATAGATLAEAKSAPQGNAFDAVVLKFVREVESYLAAEEKKLTGREPAPVAATTTPRPQGEIPPPVTEANKRRNASTPPPLPYGQIINPEPSAVIVPTTPPPWLAGRSTPEPRQPGGPPVKTGPGGKATTPLAEIDKDGNIIVPGAGMKFTANGDIFDAKGQKVFDAKTGVWAKDSPSQTAPVPPVQIGETSAQLTARLGKPEIRGSSSVFRQGDWTIGVEFHEDRAENVIWRKPLGLAVKFTSEALYAMARDPEPDVLALRRLHAGDQPWAEIGSDVAVIQKGGVVRLIAGYKPDAKELADRSLLYLPDITWRSGTLRFNFTVSARDGKLDKSLRIATQDYENRQRAKRPVVKEE